MDNLEELPDAPDDFKTNIKDLLKFAQVGARIDLKTIAVDYILCKHDTFQCSSRTPDFLALTGTVDNVRRLLVLSEALISLISLLHDRNTTVCKNSALCLINITADVYGPRYLLTLSTDYCPPLQKPPKNIVEECVNQIFNPESEIADECCMILSNLTRDESAMQHTYELFLKSDFGICDLINIFTRTDYNKKGAKLHYLATWLCNMTQEPSFREYILVRNRCVIQRLLPFTEYQESSIRRGGIIGTLRNCCFEIMWHEWLLSDKVDILPRLLLPLAGNEEFDEEDNDKLPLELQYLPEDKTREPDPDLRKMLLEAITQLCTERKNREFIRDKNTYVILRELHKWEKDPVVLTACENLVDLLIRTEDEIDCANLKELDIPEDIEDKFKKLDI